MYRRRTWASGSADVLRHQTGYGLEFVFKSGAVILWRQDRSDSTDPLASMPDGVRLTEPPVRTIPSLSTLAYTRLQPGKCFCDILMNFWSRNDSLIVRQGFVNDVTSSRASSISSRVPGATTSRLATFGQSSPPDDQPHRNTTVAGSKNLRQLEAKLCLEIFVRRK